MNLDWNGFCQRCLVTTKTHTMSWFNEQLICDHCSDREKEQKNYVSARRAEEEALRDGNYNFIGIGLDGE